MYKKIDEKKNQIIDSSFPNISDKSKYMIYFYIPYEISMLINIFCYIKTSYKISKHSLETYTMKYNEWRSKYCISNCFSIFLIIKYNFLNFFFSLVVVSRLFYIMGMPKHITFRIINKY